MSLDTKKITREVRMKHWMQLIKQYYYWQHKIRIQCKAQI